MFKSEDVIITINDQANIGGKLMRRIKYLIYKLKEKFSQILFTRVHLNTEGQSPKEIMLKVVIGLPGREIVYRTKSTVAEEAVQNTYLNLKRLLSKKTDRSY
jgi:ribosome-associated translation inhibitor RaiA